MTIYKFDEVPNIDVLDKRVKWWNEDYICIEGDEVTFRLANPDDADIIFQWRNDETARKASFSSDMIDYNDHLKWYENVLNDKNRTLYIASHNDILIGFVRFDKSGFSAEVSVFIAPEYRNEGYGSTLIRLATGLYFKNNNIETIFAEIKHHNKVSVRVFKKAGYGLTSIEPDHVVMVVKAEAVLR